MAAPKDTAPPTWIDGLLEIKGGINSGVAPLLLPPGQLAFATNCTMRGNLIQPRPSYQLRSITFPDTTVQTGFENGLWQNACWYKPDSGTEKLRCQVGGRIFEIDPVVSPATITELTIAGDPNPSDAPFGCLFQAEKWTIALCVDSSGVASVPVFTDETSSRRSLVNSTVSYNSNTTADLVIPPIGDSIASPLTLATPTTGAINSQTVLNFGTGGTFLITGGSGTNSVTLKNLTATQVGATLKAPFAVSYTATAAELPPARIGTYGMGRVVLTLQDGKQFMFGDIVGGPSGSYSENFRDSVLKSTENSYLAGGGYFTVPGSVGDIKAMAFSATLDTSLGQGPLQVFTPNTVFSCNVPVDRSTWNTLTNPILTEAMVGGGGLGQDSTLVVNSDFVMRSVDGVRSLRLARAYFQDRWSNVPISQELERVLKNDDDSLLLYGSAVNFNNRMLMTVNPVSGPQGVYFPGLVSLDFDPNSNLGQVDNPVWDGLWEGINILRVVRGQFAGVTRCFAFCYNPTLLKIELYEILTDGDAYADNTATPITWAFETAPFFRNVKGKGEFDLAQLLDGELYVDDVRGQVNFQVYYKPDQYPCWTLWHQWSICADENNPLGTTTDSTLQPQYLHRMGFGEPDPMVCQQNSELPMRIGRTFQVKVVVQGHCRITGLLAKCVHYPETRFAKPICVPICTTALAEVTLYKNTEQCYTASRGSGYLCLYPTTICIEAGQIVSEISQADADAKALAIATYQALNVSECVYGYWNTQQEYTATCPVGQSGSPVTKYTPEMTYFSEVSQADADAQALAAAKSEAEAALVCSGLFYNTEQSYTATCPSSECGYPVTITVPAGTFTSSISVSQANADALAYAQTTAEAELSCYAPWQNTEQSYTATCPAGYTGYPVTVTVPAGSFDSCVSQADADAQAYAYAQTTAESELSCTALSDWAERVVANGGAMPSAATINCMNNLYQGLMDAGLISKIKSMCIFVPDSLIAATTPLVTAMGNDPWTNHNFLIGDLNVDGLEGDGSTKYLDTGVLADVGHAVDNVTADTGLTVVVTKSSMKKPAINIGATEPSGAFLALMLQVGGDPLGLDMIYTSTTRSSPDYLYGHPLQRCGYVSGNTLSGVQTIYQATPQDDHATFGSNAHSGSGAGAHNIFAFATNSTTTDTPSSFSESRMAMAAIHSGLTEAESATFWGLLQTCLTCLGGGAGDRATDWAYRVQANGGAAPAGSSVTAIRNFWDDLYAAGINTKMVLMNVFAPDSLTAAITPLVNRMDGNDPWTNTNFVGADISASGLQGDGSTKYLDTGTVPNNILSGAPTITENSAGISVMLSLVPARAAFCEDVGCSSPNYFQLNCSSTGTNENFGCWGSSSPDALSVATPTNPFAGFYSANRTSANDMATYAASTSHAFSTLGTVASAKSVTTEPIYPMWAFCRNTAGSPQGYSDRTMSFAAVTQGLDSTDAEALYNAVVTLRTAFGGGSP